MTPVALGIVAIVIASLFIFLGIGPTGFAWRVAAVLTLFGLAAVTVPIQPWLIRMTGKGAGLVGQLGALVDPQIGRAIALLLIPLISGVFGLLWVAAMLPNFLAKWLGPIAGRQYSHAVMWGGAAALGIFSGATGGAWGRLLVAVHDLLAPLGEDLTRRIGGA